MAITLKDDYFVRGAGLPGRFKAEKVEFHWGPSNGSEGSEHSIDGRRFPVEVSSIYKVVTYQRMRRHNFQHEQMSVLLRLLTLEVVVVFTLLDSLIIVVTQQLYLVFKLYFVNETYTTRHKKIMKNQSRAFENGPKEEKSSA